MKPRNVVIWDYAHQWRDSQRQSIYRELELRGLRCVQWIDKSSEFVENQVFHVPAFDEGRNRIVVVDKQGSLASVSSALYLIEVK